MIISGKIVTYSLCAIFVVGVILLIAMFILGKKGIIEKKGRAVGSFVGCLVILVSVLALWLV